MNLARIVLVVVVAAFTLAGAIALVHYGIYGWTIFVFAPVVAGALGASMFPSETAGGAVVAGALSASGALALFLLLGIEGLICIAMALPLAAPLGALGGWWAHAAFRSSRQPRTLLSLALLPAGVLYDVKAPSPLYEVRTSIEIDAAPQEVWKHVVAFTDLPEPQEWFFRAGLAYPKRARIEGAGTGAIRYCEFSTGAFVEPIVVWDEPRLLRFRVTENPPPMQEWSPYGRIAPKHLNGYMVSERGQFRLVPLAGGRTRLEGTTWYRHGLAPSEYWRWWSDAIIHRIHLRVLRHIRNLAQGSYSGRSS